MAFEIKPSPSTPGEIKLNSLQEKERRLKELLDLKELRDGLPFLYGWKWYKWAKDFYDSSNKINLLCAANQISKSSTQIRKCINWATDKKLWPDLWNNDPVQFWYLYPSQKQVNAEFETKWKLFLPKGKFATSETYGYSVEKGERGAIVAIHFNSGVHVYFKTYSQNPSSLQSGTCDAIFCDEELIITLYEELMFRLTASNGYFHMVFTATLGQDFWRRAMEPENGEEEILPSAFKQTVSLYDSQTYLDGSPGQWTNERIADIIQKCSTDLEVLKRVHGRFILIGGRKYESFDIKRHVKEPHPLPKSWFVFAGADSGSGGENHKAALCYVAVSPDFRQGRVFLGWRGDGVETTTGDLIEKHISLKKEHNIKCMGQYYDWSDRDFAIISARMKEGFEKADKSHEVGEGILNTLFKNDMLVIYSGPETSKLITELATLRANQPKNKAKDDFSDALRYATSKIPWDFSWIVATKKQKESAETLEKPLTTKEIEARDRRAVLFGEQIDKSSVDQEFDEWNDAYG